MSVRHRHINRKIACVAIIEVKHIPIEYADIGKLANLKRTQLVFAHQVVRAPGSPSAQKLDKRQHVGLIHGKSVGEEPAARAVD